MEEDKLGVVGAALEREHREIDAGIEAFDAAPEVGGGRVESLTGAIAALRRHIYLEEAFLFPGLRSELAVPTIVMLREHGEIWRTLDDLEAQLASSGSDQQLRALCRELLARLAAHNGKEEPIFYTRADPGLARGGRRAPRLPRVGADAGGLGVPGGSRLVSARGTCSTSQCFC